jgi:exopolysaccharide biosynthesis protein
MIVMMKPKLLIGLLILIVHQWSNVTAQIDWETLEDGLEFANPEGHIKSSLGDSKVRILRIDPTKFSFKLVSAKELKSNTMTAPGWAKKENLIAVINAGMYQMDYGTNVGYMKNYSFVNNPKLNKDNTIIAFNRKDESVPPFQIIDRTCQDWDVLKEKYHSLTQSIRMVDCNQKNRWSQQPRKWSIACMAVDKSGRVLMLHSRSPYSVRDFISIILNLPLDIYNMIYLEGGPEASFYLKHEKKTVGVMGSYETGFFESDDNKEFWAIPNVIGLARKSD